MNKEIKDAKHQGRIYQTGIYLGKFFRMLIFQNDWKVMPIAALIAGLVALVMKNSLFTTMEGTLLGSFAMYSNTVAAALTFWLLVANA